MIRTKRLGKRGSIEDAVYISIFAVVLAIFAFPMFSVIFNLNAIVQGNTYVDAQSAAVHDDFTNRWPSIFEGIYLMIFLISYLGTFILASRIDTNPAFFVLAAIVFTAMAFVLPMLANAWDSIQGNGFIESQGQFVIIPYIMNNYLQITIVMWVLVAVGVYAKRFRL